MDVLYYSLSDSLSSLQTISVCVYLFTLRTNTIMRFILQVNCNLYGQHPFFIGMEEKTGQAYGVFLLNSNAMRKSHTFFSFIYVTYILNHDIKVNKS